MAPDTIRFIDRLLRWPATMLATTRLWMSAGMVDSPVPASRSMPPAELIGPLNEVEQRHAPQLLFVAGHLDVMDSGPRVAVIGSRRATIEGLAAAAKVAHELCASRIVVVSGLAAGIDTAAHVAAIEAGGRTIGVLGTPLDKAYPAANAGLQRTIATDHLLVSQFAPGTRTRPEHFVLRNRTIALLADAAIIVEAGESSGTQHLGWEMIRLGRPVFLHDRVASDSRLKWPTKLMDHGARMLRDLDEVVDELPSVGRLSRVHAPF